MKLDDFITFLGLVAAALAIVTRVQLGIAVSRARMYGGECVRFKPGDPSSPSQTMLAAFALLGVAACSQVIGVRTLEY